MINTAQQKKREGIVKGCLLPLLVVIAMVASCYGLCMILFLLQPAAVRGGI